MRMHPYHGNRATPPSINSAHSRPSPRSNHPSSVHKCVRCTRLLLCEKQLSRVPSWIGDTPQTSDRERYRYHRERRESDGDVQDGGGEGGGRARIRRGAAAAGGGGGLRGAGAARGDAAARGAAGPVRGRHDRHAPRPAEQRVRHRRLLRPGRVQVPRLRQRPLRRLLAHVRLLHRRAQARHRVALLGRLRPRPGVHVPDPRGWRGGGGAAVPRLQRRQGGDVERGVRRVRRLLPPGAHLRGHHLRLRALLHPPLAHLLLPPLQRLRGAPVVRARQQGRRDRRVPALKGASDRRQATKAGGAGCILSV